AQAGSSGPGMELGSSIGEMIYTAQPDKDRSIEFYAKFKELAAGKGRNPDHVKIIPGILPILGDTEAEAQELADELGRYDHLENGRTQVGADLRMEDRKSTRLNSSHVSISYAVFCLKKK